MDIYIIGSNAYLLSCELATLLSGQYVEISMLPLSFADYMRRGGFPYAALLRDVEDKLDMYLEGIYNTIILKDIEERQKRRETDPNKRKITDLIQRINERCVLAPEIIADKGRECFFFDTDSDRTCTVQKTVPHTDQGCIFSKKNDFRQRTASVKCTVVKTGYACRNDQAFQFFAG